MNDDDEIINFIFYVAEAILIISSGMVSSATFSN